jgi:hypothetical protein
VQCEQQLIEPPLYPAVPVMLGLSSAPPHGGVNSYFLETIPSDTLCAAGFSRIMIEPQVGSACRIVQTNDFRTAFVP